MFVSRREEMTTTMNFENYSEYNDVLHFPNNHYQSLRRGVKPSNTPENTVRLYFSEFFTWKVLNKLIFRLA